MKIKFIGHACFFNWNSRVKNNDRSFDKSLPYDFPDGIEVDIVTVSHDHFDHSATNRVKVRKEILKDQ